MSWLGNKSDVALADALGCKRAQHLQVLVVDGNSPRLDRRGAAFLPCLPQSDKTLIALQILDDTNENHLLMKKIDMYVQFRQVGSATIGWHDYSDGLWPCVLG
jgi:hypothetical protein